MSARGSLPFALILLMALTAAARAQRLPLPPGEQEAVNNAIDHGVNYLKRTQLKSGTWAKIGMGRRIGYAVLPGLTLLECGFDPSDPIVQQAAGYLRARAATLDTTYELALGLLFLDRLGEAKDKKIIRTFALRLIAGQSATGGWGYKCPLLGGKVQKELLTALRHLDPPPNGMPLLARGPDKKASDLTPIAPPSDGTSRVESSGGESLAPQEPIEPPPDEKDVEARTDKDASPKLDAKDGKPNPLTPAKPYVIPERLKMLTVIQDPARHLLQDPPRMAQNLFTITTDNSNTQFAMLALWTAQRYEVPMNRTLNLIVRRYLTSQNANGGWNYHYHFGGAAQHEGFSSAGAMTCVGLIGLAVGHGLAWRGAADKPVQDPRIVNGLIALNQWVGQPAEQPIQPPMQNLYFLWSLERVAVLYNLPTIGEKDWYRWGAQVLVAYQHKEGNWANGQYPGNSPPLDTCLALLFLKRANLAKDLTDKLPFKAADLNDGITGKMRQSKPLPPPPKKTIPAVEPSKPAEADDLPAMPPPPSEGTAHADETSKDESGGKTKWIILFAVLFVILSAGSLFFIFLAVKRRKEEEIEEKQGKRKGSKKKRKLQSSA